MNLLARAKLAIHLISPSPAKPNFALLPFTTAAQSNGYATKAASEKKKKEATNAMATPAKKKLSEPTGISKDIKKQLDAKPTVRRKRRRPTEITYQGKVSNLVNLIGLVKNPVQYQSRSDGKYCAETLISQESKKWGTSLLIPVVFKGDLADVAYDHLKVNDRILVSGKLSFDGKLHIVATELKFVEGYNPKVVNREIQEPIVDVGDDEDFDLQSKDDIFNSAKAYYSTVKISSADAVELQSEVEALPVGAVGDKEGKDGDSWKNSVGDPSKLRDYRLRKKDPNAPDWWYRG